MSRHRGAPLRWRVLALLAAPYLVFVAALGIGAFQIAPDGIHVVRGATPSAAVRLCAATLAVLALAFLVLLRDQRFHFFGYAFYSLALALAIAFGSLRALVNSLGGIEGDTAEPGAVWVTVVLIAGAAVALLGIVAIAAQIVAELRPRDAPDAAPLS